MYKSPSFKIFTYRCTTRLRCTTQSNNQLLLVLLTERTVSRLDTAVVAPQFCSSLSTPGDAPVACVFERRPAVRSKIGEGLEVVASGCLQGAIQTTDTEPSSSASNQEHQEREDRSEMPEEALDGDTEGRSRDEKKESEESEEQSDITRKKNNDSEVETTDENVKDLRVKYEVVDFEEVKEEDEDHDDDDDDDDDDDEGDDDYSESEDSWFNRVQKKRNEEEKDYVWIRAIDKDTYLKVMAPLYLLLEVRSPSPLQVQHVRTAVSHLSRMWQWWGVSVRHRGQERTPWLCVAPTQRPTLQVSGVDEDEDEDELWDLVDQQQWRHTKVAEGMLSSVTLITHPRLSAVAAAVAAAPHAHRNEEMLSAADDDNGAAGASNTTSVPTNNPTPGAVLTNNPTPGAVPTNNPTPGAVPTNNPTPGAVPTNNPTPGAVPTNNPTPGAVPTNNPTPGAVPTNNPTPGAVPTNNPTPGAVPTNNPTPGAVPTNNPTPGAVPTNNPTPGAVPTNNPTPGAAACSEVQVNDVPDLAHKVYLILGIPRPFVDHTTAEVICHTLITLLDDVLSERIQEEYQPKQESGSHGKDTAEAESPSLESWLAERLQVVVEAKAEGGESNADPDSGCQQGEENEHDTRGYVQRVFDSVTSRNFINRCKAERVSYVNGFATCVSTAAAAFLLTAEAGEREERGQRVVTRQRVCEHLHWPAAPMEWHDGDPDEEPPPEPSSRPPGVTITAPSGEDDSVFWEAARYVSQQRWKAPAGGKKGAALHILHGLSGEDSEDDMPLQRYPMVSLRLCDIQKDEGCSSSVQRVGDVVGLGPHSLSPLRHFLITHTVNLHLEEGTQVLSFSLHHSTLFLSPGTGRSFADEIETALKNSLRRR